jgi:hypothetical protein
MRSNPPEIVATVELRPPVERDDESDASEALTIALESKRLSAMRPAAPGVDVRSSRASTGSHAEGEIERQDAYWWRRGSPRGAANTDAAGGGMPFLARENAVAPLSGTPAGYGEADLKTDIGLVVTTVMPRPDSTVLLSSPAAVTPANAHGAGAGLSAFRRLLVGRRALLAVVAGGALLFGIGVGAYEARGGPSTGVPEAVKGVRPDPPERHDEPASPAAAPTPVVDPPALPTVAIVELAPTASVKLPVKKPSVPPGGAGGKPKAPVSPPIKNPAPWLR